MPEYQFVVSDGQRKPASRIVRSHAMRTALRHKAARGKIKDRQTHNPQLADVRLTKNTKDGLNGKFRNVAKPGKKRRKQEKLELVIRRDLDYEHVMSLDNSRSACIAPSVQTQQEGTSLVPLVSKGQLGSNYLDPFSSLCVPYNPRIDVLIKYCKIRAICGLGKSARTNTDTYSLNPFHAKRVKE